MMEQGHLIINTLVLSVLDGVALQKGGSDWEDYVRSNPEEWLVSCSQTLEGKGVVARRGGDIGGRFIDSE